MRIRLAALVLSALPAAASALPFDNLPMCYDGQPSFTDCVIPTKAGILAFRYTMGAEETRFLDVDQSLPEGNVVRVDGGISYDGWADMGMPYLAELNDADGPEVTIRLMQGANVGEYRIYQLNDRGVYTVAGDYSAADQPIRRDWDGVLHASFGMGAMRGIDTAFVLTPEGLSAIYSTDSNYDDNTCTLTKGDAWDDTMDEAAILDACRDDMAAVN